eukprot:scaffold21675_cov94-Skeletonema_dohrnii-CCMP3373.AAC.1
MESQLSTQHAILLGEERNEHRPSVGVIQTGGYSFIRFVADEKEFQRFFEQMDAVKIHISDLNKSYEAGELTEPEYRASLEHRWLNVVVRAFVMKYGVNSVPIDVRNSVNDVAEYLNSDILNDIIDEGWTNVRLVSVPVDRPDFIIGEFFM